MAMTAVTTEKTVFRTPSHTVCLTELTQRWASAAHSVCEIKGLKFNCNMEKGLPERIVVDSETLTAVATLLLFNAVTFTTEGAVALTLRRAESALSIEVRDTGVGSATHVAPNVQIVTQGWRVSTERRSSQSPSGLAFIHQMVQSMNGTLNIENLPDQGHAVTMLIPLVDADATQPARP